MIDLEIDVLEIDAARCERRMDAIEELLFVAIQRSKSFAGTSYLVGARLAALLRRVFGDEVIQCPRSGDALRVLAFITDPRVTARILEHLGMSTDVVAIAPARAPPDDPVYELDFGA